MTEISDVAVGMSRGRCLTRVGGAFAAFIGPHSSRQVAPALNRIRISDAEQRREGREGRKASTMITSALARASALAALLLASAPAFASGGFSCSADDRTLKFNADGALMRRPGMNFINLGAALEIRLDAVREALRSWTFGEADVSQKWLDDRELKLQIYREWQSGDLTSFMVFVVEARAVTEGVYRGRYELTLNDAASGGATSSPRHGKVGCFVE